MNIDVNIGEYPERSFDPSMSSWVRPERVSHSPTYPDAVSGIPQ